MQAETQRQIQLPKSWLNHLGTEFEQSYMQNLCDFLAQEKQLGKIIYPEKSKIFAAFNDTEFEQVKVVILGQDPYHGPGQAEGLSFSVPEGIAIPPSLNNIYKELCSDLQLNMPSHGHLKAWALQGVLLLNSVLTVEADNAGSHQNQGWQSFTDQAIRQLSQHKEHVVFLLWGAYAKKKAALIDGKKHLVLSAAHPSPLSAYRGFLGCRHFSKTNHYLIEHGIAPIDWQIS